MLLNALLLVQALIFTCYAASVPQNNVNTSPSMAMMVKTYLDQKHTKRDPTEQDFRYLKTRLDTDFVSDANLPKLVRMSFHDLMNYNKTTQKGAAQGCIFDQRVLAFQGNGGLNGTALALQAFIAQHFSDINFSSGDIVSLAGVVALEKTNPCIKVAWEYGRQSCIDEEQFDGPDSNINTLAKLKPFNDRYGLTTLEMALLTAGGHGIKGAVNNLATSKVFPFKFADKTSGTDWIKVSATRSWVFFRNNLISKSWFGTAAPGLFFGTQIGRFPSDMMFFPSNLKKQGFGFGLGLFGWLGTLRPAIVWDDSFLPTEEHLLGLAENEAEFNKQFGAAYAKMLRIGTGNKVMTSVFQGAATC